jgi:hypothetical protein
MAAVLLAVKAARLAVAGMEACRKEANGRWKKHGQLLQIDVIAVSAVVSLEKDRAAVLGICIRTVWSRQAGSAS